MPNIAGSFIWYELMTPDPDAIAPFYAAVVGMGTSANQNRNSLAVWTTA